MKGEARSSSASPTNGGAAWSAARLSISPSGPGTACATGPSESGHDFSADICPAASFADLDLAAIEDFRRRWLARSGNQALKKLPPRQLLRDVEAMIGDQLTYAALVLFGTRPALGRHLGQAEV